MPGEQERVYVVDDIRQRQGTPGHDDGNDRLARSSHAPDEFGLGAGKIDVGA